jgi:flagellar basal-body rod modification protein FlgD
MSTSAINSAALNSLFATGNAATTKSSTSPSSSASGTGGLGESDFLNLLITQLKNQNPLDPMKDTDFIAQLANFSNLQQVTSMNTNIGNMLAQQNYTNAANMIGKQITTSDSNTGVVSKVGIESGTVYLYVGANKYTLSDITSVANPTT